MVLDNRKLKLREIADTLKISEGSVFTILYEHFRMRKACTVFYSSITLRKEEPSIVNIIWLYHGY